MGSGKRKISFPSEAAYLCGIVFIAICGALAERADFGVSVMAAPAYIIYRWLSIRVSGITYGMAMYGLQILLLLILCITIRKFKVSWLLSFASAALAAICLDLLIVLVKTLSMETLGRRIFWYVVGQLFGAAGASMMFHTYISPEVFELFDKEMSRHYRCDIHNFVTGFHVVVGVISMILSFGLFGIGRFVGLKLGSLVSACINGMLIHICTIFFEKFLHFEDFLPWRDFFESADAV